MFNPLDSFEPCVADYTPAEVAAGEVTWYGGWEITFFLHTVQIGANPMLEDIAAGHRSLLHNPQREFL